MSFCVEINNLSENKDIYIPLHSLCLLSEATKVIRKVSPKFVVIGADNRLILLLSTIFLLLFNSMHSVSGQTDFASPVLKNADLIDKNSANSDDFSKDNSESQLYFNDQLIVKQKWTSFAANETTFDPIVAKALYSRPQRYVKNTNGLNISWPVKRVAEVDGTVILGGLMMIHEREDRQICGPIMPQGGIQALECMLHTIDWINSREEFLPDITIGAYVLDDCDKDTYGLEQSVEFIKGKLTLWPTT